MVRTVDGSHGSGSVEGYHGEYSGGGRARNEHNGCCSRVSRCGLLVLLGVIFYAVASRVIPTSYRMPPANPAQEGFGRVDIGGAIPEHRESGHEAARGGNAQNVHSNQGATHSHGSSGHERTRTDGSRGESSGNAQRVESGGGTRKRATIEGEENAPAHAQGRKRKGTDGEL